MKFIRFTVLIGGILLSLSSLAHFFVGYPDLCAMLDQTVTTDKLLRTVEHIWVFSSITMFLMGVWALFIANGMKYGSKHSGFQGICLGVGVLIFGIHGFTSPFPNWHMFLFVIYGVLITLPSIAYFSKK